MTQTQERGSGNYLVECELPRRPGQINAEGFSGLLQGADENPWEVMLREAVQNSWDARGNSSFIDFSIRGRRASIDTLSDLRKILVGFQGARLLEALGTQVFMLEISDRKTTGLDGDTGYRKDDSSSNFRRFVFETGRDKKQSSGGGTYGYGKAAFFSLSQVGTVAVHTRVKIESDRWESRFILIRVDREQDPGRIWWGKGLEGDEVSWMEPLLGNQADEMAARLGMSRFDPRESGTNLLIFSPQPLPELGDGDESGAEESAFRSLSESIVRWFWPKFCTPDREIRFVLALEMEHLPIPEPATHPRYAHYVKAYLGSRNTDVKGVNKVVIRSQRPKALLGTVSWFDSDFPGPRSLAFMRDVGFIVFYKYSHRDDESHYARFGVFRTPDANEAEDERTQSRVVEAFRLSENQSHDEWNPNNCRDSWQQSVVRQALKVAWQAVSSEERQEPERRELPGSIRRLRDELGALALGKTLVKRSSTSVVASPSLVGVGSLRKAPNARPHFLNDATGIRIGVFFDYLPPEDKTERWFRILPAVRWEDGSVGTRDLGGVVSVVGMSRLHGGEEVPIDGMLSSQAGALTVALMFGGRYVVYAKVAKPMVLDLVVQNANSGAPR